MKTIHAFNGTFAGRWTAAMLTSACALALFGCSSHSDNTPSTASTPSAPVAPAAPPPPSLMQIHADEDGQVPVLTFGDIVSGSSASAGNVTVAQFKKDLDWLYAHDYRPVGLKDFAAGKIDVPAGKSPVVLTFDGGTPGQFRTMPDGSTDPNCASSILEAFNNQHPDWALKGGFMIPAALGKTKSEFGGKSVAYKLEHLIGDGFDIGCALPSTIASLPADKLQATIANGITDVASAGVETPEILAVPDGAYPKSEAVLHTGQTTVKSLMNHGHPGRPDVPPSGPTTHIVSYTAVCTVTGGNQPSRSPADKLFDAYRISRITIDGSHPVDAALKSLTDRFVSDGDPTTIAVPEPKKNDVNEPMLQQAGITIKTYPGSIASAH